MNDKCKLVCTNGKFIEMEFDNSTEAWGHYYKHVISEPGELWMVVPVNYVYAARGVYGNTWQPK